MRYYTEIEREKIVSGPFRLREKDSCPPQLAESIAAHGLFSPLLVRQEENQWLLVHGHRRFAALAAQGADRMPARVISAAVPLEDLLARLAAEHRESGNLSPVGIGRLLALAGPKERNGQERLLSILGENPRHHRPELFLSLLELPEEARLAVDRGRNQAASALELARDLSPGARGEVCGLITGLGLSRASQRGLIIAVRELARRQGKDEAATARELAALARQSRGNPRQRAAAFARMLEKRLHPRLEATQEEFARFTAALDLPDNVSLAPAPAFESDRVTARIVFDNREQCKKFWEQAKGFLATPRLS